MPKTRIGDLDVAWDVAGPADGAPVLLINGLGAVRGSWHLQVAALSERYRVYSYDNRDVGETGAGANPAPYAIAQFAQDAAALLETLETGPAHVVGASMGGCIAQELALHRPDLVHSVQIVCSWARSDPWLDELFRCWDGIFAAMGPVVWGRNTGPWVFTHRWYEHAENLAAAEEEPHPQSAAMFTRQCQAAIDFDARQRIAAIAAPVHVVAGAEDLLTPVRFSEEIAAAIPGAKLTVLPQVGHGMFWETPDTFNAALLDFIAAHPR